MRLEALDKSALAPQFTGCVAGRTLILDGDGPAYRVAATVKRLDTAIRRFQQTMLTELFLTNSQSVRIHLTASGSDKAGRYRIKAVKPYQGQRDNKAKPSLLEPLREAMANRENWLPEFDFVKMNYVVEADDAMMQDAYECKEDGLIWSDDKDLRMTPYPYWCRKRGMVLPSAPQGYVEMAYTDSGTAKCLGQGPMFFWAQMLMGDQADHIQGILKLDGKNCAAVGAFNALKSITQVAEAANLVLDAYRKINQNPLPEGWLLWLLRYEGDSFWKYLSELDITQDNRRYLDECVNRDWFVKG